MGESKFRIAQLNLRKKKLQLTRQQYTQTQKDLERLGENFQRILKSNESYPALRSQAALKPSGKLSPTLETVRVGLHAAVTFLHTGTTLPCRNTTTASKRPSFDKLY